MRGVPQVDEGKLKLLKTVVRIIWGIEGIKEIQLMENHTISIFRCLINLLFMLVKTFEN